MIIYPFGVIILCFVEGLNPHVIRVVHDGTEVIHRLDQLANHADGLRARVEVDAIFSLSRVRVPCCQERLGVLILCIIEESSKLFCPNCR